MHFAAPIQLLDQSFWDVCLNGILGYSAWFLLSQFSWDLHGNSTRCMAGSHEMLITLQMLNSAQYVAVYNIISRRCIITFPGKISS